MAPSEPVLVELARERLNFLQRFSEVFAGCMIGVAAVLCLASYTSGSDPLETAVYAGVLVGGVATWLLSARAHPEQVIPVQIGISTLAMCAIYLTFPNRTSVAFFSVPIALMGVLALRVRVGLAMFAGIATLLAIATVARSMAMEPWVVADTALALSASITLALVQRLRDRWEARQLRDAYLDLEEARTSLELAALRAESAAREARAANEAKSRFLASMSHELRTPLNAMLGYTELVREEAELDEDCDADLERVEQAGRHLLGLIDDVLDIARIESGGRSIHPEPIDLQTCAAEAAAWIRPRVDEGSNRLELEVQPITIDGDPVLVRQILLNLLGNATRHTQNGTITIRIRDEGTVAAIEVEDDGEGIAPDDLAVVFEPFRRGANAAHRHGGAGLGLALVDRFARLLGGSVEVRSELGRGTCFTVSLPKSQMPQTVEPTLAHAPLL